MPKVNDQVISKSVVKRLKAQRGDAAQTPLAEVAGTLRAAPEAGDGQSGLAGRELDAAVAERVMDFSWRVFPNGRSLVPHKTAPLAKGDEPIHPNSGSQVPHYSTLIADAMEVVEKMRERGYFPCLWAAQLWNVEFWDEDHQFAGSRSEDSLSEAICHAALNTVNATE